MRVELKTDLTTMGVARALRNTFGPLGHMTSDNKIRCIKLVRDLFGLSFKEAKEWVEGGLKTEAYIGQTITYNRGSTGYNQTGVISEILLNDDRLFLCPHVRTELAIIELNIAVRHGIVFG